MCSWSSRKISMILLIFIHLSSSVNALDNPSWCTSNGNYTRSSTYSANLNTLLSSLSSNMTDYGYYTSSVGQSPNTANGLALCRGDRTLDECRACVESATREVLQLCPNQKQAVIWHEYCTVRYSNDSIHSEQTISNNIKIIIINSQNASDGNRLREARARLLVDLTAQAVSGTSKLKVGVGMKSYSNWTIYGLAQCKPDFSLENCRLCLTRISQGWESYVSLGIRLLVPGCNIRYEPLGFYNETRLMEQRVLFPQPSPLPPQPPPPPPPSPSPSPSLPPSGISDDNSNVKPRMKVIIIIVVVVGVTLIFGACGIIFMRKRKKQRAYEMTEIDISTVKSLQYDFSRIRAATNDFDNTNKLGEGGFGAVYKGRLHTGDEVAVKRLSKNSGQGNTEFKNEVLLVAKLQHKNLVRLLGFSMEGIERVLIYEFVQNASLDQFIFDPIKGSLLDWVTHYRIIVGIAKGVLYLHEDSRLKIIHRDLKASNILLDGNMNPKISDFGMARLFKQDESQANTNKIVGTYGYMAPEYAMHGEFSIKSDVFSFGVLVLEIIGGKRNTCKRYSDHVEDLLTITWKNWLDGTAEMIIDPVLRNESGPARDMVRCIHVGLLCVQENAAKRPTMASVVQMLGSSTINLPIPCEPAFYMSSPMHTRETGGSEGSRPTQNNVSITELHPR